MKTIICITGACGSGKTTLLKELESKLTIPTYYADDIGVPSLDIMINEHGSPLEWQRAKTKEWFRIICAKNAPVSILEGQMRHSFIMEAADETNVRVKTILIDCTDDERKRRLIARGTPEHWDEDIVEWSAFLRREATELRGKIILNNDKEKAKRKLLAQLRAWSIEN